MPQNARRDLEVYSSVEGTAFFRRLVMEWGKEGWSVASCHVVSERQYRAQSRMLGRTWLRWKMYGVYALACFSAVLRGRARSPLRVVTTNPFFAPALVRWVAGKEAITINLLYDLFPDALVEAGVLGANSLPTSYCAAITRTAIRKCAATVFLGERLRHHAEAVYGAARRGVVIAVGADGSQFAGKPPLPRGSGKPVEVLYAGQMGRMHEAETFLRLCDRGLGSRIVFRFHSSGCRYALLRRSVAAGPNLILADALAESDWRATMLRAHVALVTIAPGAERVVMPSKTYSALVAGQAVLAICSPESDLADLVRRHDCGWVVKPGDVDELGRVLHLIESDPAMLQRKRENAYEAGHRDYDVGVIASQWQDLFDSLRALDSS